MTDNRKQKYRIAYDSDGKTFARWAWPGGYPVFHLCKDSSVLCAACANADRNDELLPEDSRVVASDINWEDAPTTLIARLVPALRGWQWWRNAS